MAAARGAQLLLQMAAAYSARLGRKRRVRLGSVRAAGARQCGQAAWGRPGTASLVLGRAARCGDGEESDDWRRAAGELQIHSTRTRARVSQRLVCRLLYARARGR